jgi:hypothetical protein
LAGFDEVASELESIARHLRRAGEQDLAQELTAAFRRAVQPVPREIRAGLKPHLPDPYADVLNADLSLTVSVKSSEHNPGVSVRGTTRGAGGVQRRRIRRLDQGILAHPLWGNREHWFNQPVEPGWFTGVAETAKPRVRRELEQALDIVNRKIASKGL